ncbi:hypothetical protein ABZ478_37440 [Streptomyces sp. NPDC005706]
MPSQKALRGVRRRLLTHAVTHQAVGIVLARYPGVPTSQPHSS